MGFFKRLFKKEVHVALEGHETQTDPKLQPIPEKQLAVGRTLGGVGSTTDCGHSRMSYGAVDYYHEYEHDEIDFSRLDLEEGRGGDSPSQDCCDAATEANSLAMQDQNRNRLAAGFDSEYQHVDLELGSGAELCECEERPDDHQSHGHPPGLANIDGEQQGIFRSVSSLVYLTEDGENLEDSVSVVSDALTEQELFGELEELNRALELLESEGPSSPRGTDVATIASGSSSVAAAAAAALPGTSPTGSFAGTTVSGGGVPPEQYAKNMVKLYNDLAVRLMDAKDYEQALRMLRKAEALLDNDSAWLPAAPAESSLATELSKNSGDSVNGGGEGSSSSTIALRNAIDDNGHFLGVGEAARGESSVDESGYELAGPGGGSSSASILTKRAQLRAITYNNTGCLQKRRGMPLEAMEYLQNALSLEESAGNVRDCASTHLNICAAHSALAQYKEALDHAERAILMLQRDIWAPVAVTFQEGIAHVAVTLQSLNAPDATAEARHRARRLTASVSVLAMAYHNAAVEHERLDRFREAQVSYSRACTLGTRFLGAKSPTTVALISAQKAFIAQHTGAQQQQHPRGSGGVGGHHHHHHHSGAPGPGVRKGHVPSATTKVRQTATRARYTGSTSVARAAGGGGGNSNARSKPASSKASTLLGRERR